MTERKSMKNRTGRVVTSPGPYDPHFFAGPEDCPDCVAVTDTQAVEFIWGKEGKEGKRCS